MEREIGDPLGPIGHPVGKDFVIRRALRGLDSAIADLRLHFLRSTPPTGLPKGAADHFLGGVTTGLETKPVRLQHDPIHVYDRGENRRLIKDGAELGRRRDVCAVSSPSRSSARLRAVMSIATPGKRAGRPEASRSTFPRAVNHRTEPSGWRIR